MARLAMVAALGFSLLAGPAAAEFVPFTMMQNDIQRALGRLAPKPAKPKARKPAKAENPSAGKTEAKLVPTSDPADTGHAKTEPAKVAPVATPLPRLRPPAAPETTAIGGFTGGPEFSEADESPAVGGFLAGGGDAAATASEPEGPALAYAAPQPPIPRINPRAVAALGDIPAGDQPLKGKAPVRVAALPPATETGIDAAGGKTGMTRLAALGVTAKPLPPIRESACSVDDPVVIASLEGGDIPLSGVAKVNGTVAATFALWVHGTVAPAAKSILGGELTGLRIADSYSCRTRDHIKGAKLSEHAFGNAIDVSAFRIGKKWIEVGGRHDSDEQAFIGKIRTAACGPFKTVLGPGSDSFHTDHLHLDLAKRRTNGPSRGLYCK